MDINISKLESLLAERKLDEAGALISDAVAAPMNSVERGAAIAGLTEAYLDLSAAVDASYLEALNDTVAELKLINGAEKKLSENIQINDVKKSLGIQPK